ncbi:hypothetical protein P153DRAFT_432325 [Dothidotthia symphoricarpi CBS 119687]|uniref:MYND-type domain-containing protein n=1 Tax=Dothidotthia symphoricarpi CBS 119687 TaxID=1392245 RepID=A0A6A6A784_9PLEO|nr:uncharacterized protein P153DRAFT_432325 [Dothidotthia symphoricarpi CBS 119687]KAF2127882.1 hypothetical protein P153DRAFT_432325 [Dothidotthia symphoricarpi CBS 119687]
MSSTAPQDFGQPFVLEDYIPIQQPVTTTSPALCAVCHKPASHQRCSKCKSINYCSNTCQTTDWPAHKILCAPFLRSHVTRPGPTFRRALLFPEHNAKPKFIWLEYGTNDGRPLDMPAYFPSTPPQEIKTIAFHNRFLPYWIQVSYDSNASSRVLQDNAGLQDVRGGVVVLAYDLDVGLSGPALDVGPGVLGPVREYFALRRGYRGPVFVEQPQERYEEGVWREFMKGGG